MYGNSRTILSSQKLPHARLREVFERHRAHVYQRPISEHARRAFAETSDWLAARPGRPLLLDSGCGTGASTRALAARRPDANVIGVDQSADRLAREPGPDLDGAHADQVLLVRAPLEDYWRLLLAAGVRVDTHLLWYPNPWPKPEHLMRRWHAHPVFPTVLELGSALELRSNWSVYVDECALVLGWAGWQVNVDELAADAPAVTPFERKYRDSGHALWRCRARAGAASGDWPPA